MDRSPHRQHLILAWGVACALIAFTGCHQILATAVFLWSGVETPAEYAGLEARRVVVICRPPSSLEYRDAGAARDLAKRVGMLIRQNVPEVDVVDARDVENWADESDVDDFEDLADALNADVVVRIELEDFDLYKGQTLYQGRASVSLSVYDVTEGRRVVWEKSMGETLFPENSAVPAQEKAVHAFRRQFLDVLAEKVACHFYDHDPRHMFAIDAAAHR